MVSSFPIPFLRLAKLHFSSPLKRMVSIQKPKNSCCGFVRFGYKIIGRCMRPFPQTIRKALNTLRSARDELRRAFPQLRFALDGNLIGDIGEAIAICHFGLEKLKPCSTLHDFKARNGNLVQVKTTQQTIPGKGVGLGLIKKSFKHLIVIQLLENGYEILFDGPGKTVDKARAHKKTASLSVKQLCELNQTIQTNERLIK